MKVQASSGVGCACRVPRVGALVLLLVAAGAPLSASAQFGLYQLPSQNFIWNWGKGESHGPREDFSVSGGESGFRCDLTGAMRIGHDFSPTERLAFEQQLSTSLQFIYDATTTMNQLDLQLALEWAQLDCKKAEAKPLTEEQKADREARARAKAQAEVERRRAKRAHDGGE
jgi:hypothetical protein